jgi:hypothetical protein
MNWFRWKIEQDFSDESVHVATGYENDPGLSVKAMSKKNHCRGFAKKYIFLPGKDA